MNSEKDIEEAGDTAAEMLKGLEPLLEKIARNAVIKSHRDLGAVQLGIMHALLKCAAELAIVSATEQDTFLAYAAEVFDFATEEQVPMIDDSGNN